LAVAKNAPAGANVHDVLRQAGFSLKTMFFGLEPGSIGETSALCVLIGAVILVVSGVGACALWRALCWARRCGLAVNSCRGRARRASGIPATVLL
jgi:Na+-transporting NADH:ubiquinone oxidoreductase subunit NqrB